jgi:hypothetical protein
VTGRAWAAVALLFALLAGSVVLAPAASAIPGITDCKEAPTPEVPGRGLVGFFEGAPDPLPPAADPWAPNPTTTVFQQYGYAGIHWHTYDLGCGPDLAKNPDAVTGTAVANWGLMVPKAAIAATGATLAAAFSPEFLGVFDPIVSQVVTGLRDGVWTPWFPIVVAALGVFLIWMSRKQRVSESAQAIGWALLVMMAVTVIFRWPLVAGHAADESVTAVLSGVADGLNGQQPGTGAGAASGATAGMHDALLYKTWLGGTFGSATSPTAVKYGPRIFKDTALTWAEADLLRRDPAAGKKLIEDKQDDFEKAAEEIKESDPDAYDALSGKHSDDRVGFAALALLGTLCTIPFLFLAALLVLGALFIVRFGVALFPAFATLGLFPRLRHLVTGIAETVAAALINAVVFGCGAMVFILFLGASFASTISPWLKIVVALLLTVIFWVGLKPYRRLTQMASGRETFKGAVSAPVEFARGVGRVGARVGGAILTGGVAGATAGKILEEETPAPPQRVEGQADAGPVIVHPPNTAVPTASERVVIVASTRDLPPPNRPAITAAPDEPDEPAGPVGVPARIEGSEPAFDWSRAEDQFATKETQ